MSPLVCHYIYSIYVCHLSNKYLSDIAINNEAIKKTMCKQNFKLPKGQGFEP